MASGSERRDELRRVPSANFVRIQNPGFQGGKTADVLLLNCLHRDGEVVQAKVLSLKRAVLYARVSADWLLSQ